MPDKPIVMIKNTKYRFHERFNLKLNISKSDDVESISFEFVFFRQKNRDWLREKANRKQTDDSLLMLMLINKRSKKRKKEKTKI